MSRNAAGTTAMRAGSDRAARVLAFVFWGLSVVVVGTCHLTTIRSDGDLAVSRLGEWESDEGVYSYNAASLVRHGQLITPGDLNTCLNNPVLTLLQSAVFRVLGVSLRSSRLQGLLAFTVAQAAFLLFWRRQGHVEAGTAGLLLVSFDYLLFTYSRWGSGEAWAGAWLAAVTWVLFHRPLAGARRGVALAVVGFLATATKPTLVALPFSAGLFLLLEGLAVEDRDASPRRTLRTVGAYLGTLLVLAALFYVFWVLPHPHERQVDFAGAFPADRFTRSVGGSLRNLSKLLGGLAASPWRAVPFLLGCSALLGLFRGLRRRDRSAPVLVLLWGSCVTLAFVLEVGVNSYQPPRYASPLVWPLALMTSAWLATEFRDGGPLGVLSWRSVPPAVAAFAFLTTAPGLETPLLSGLLVVAATVLVAAFASRTSSPALATTSVGLFAGALSALTFASSFSSWQARTSESFAEALDDLGAVLPPGSVVMGRMAPFVALEHDVRAYYTVWAIDGSNPAPDFVILNRGDEELREWVTRNPRVAEALSGGWDSESFPPRRYRIMQNYYSGRDTVVRKVRKP